MKSETAELLRIGDEESRRCAVRKLEALPLRETRDILFFAMGDDSWRVRKEAVDIFVASSPDDDSVGMLLELLRNEDNAGLRNSAAEAVCRIGSKTAPRLFIMASDPDPDVRKIVLDCLVKIGSSEFIPCFRERLYDSDINVASAAAEHLGAISDDSSVPDIVQAIIRNPSVHFRFTALSALGRMSSRAEIPAEIISLCDSEILKKALYECLGSISDASFSKILLEGFLLPEKSSRRAAASGWYRIFMRSSVSSRKRMENELLTTDIPRVAEALVELYGNGSVSDDEAIIAILGLTGYSPAIPFLLDAFADERLCGVALSSLKRSGQKGMLKLEVMYDGADENTKCLICMVFGACGYQKGERILLEALKDPSPVLRKTALGALGETVNREMLAEVAQLLNDPDRDVSSASLLFLQRFDLSSCEPARSVVFEAASSPYPEKRSDSAILLAIMEDAERLSLLAKDEYPLVREAAFAAIGKRKVPVDPLLIHMAFLDEEPDVRIAAIEAAASLGDFTASPALRKIIAEDEDAWVKSAAIRTFSAVAPEYALQLLKETAESAGGLLLVTCLELLDSIAAPESTAIIESVLQGCDPDGISLAVEILGR